MKESPQTEKRAAEVLLQKGVKIRVRAPWFLRLFRKKSLSLTVSSLYEGTVHRVAHYYLSTGIAHNQLENTTIEQALSLMKNHGKALSKAVACAVLNGYVSGWLFTPMLARFLRWNAKPSEITTLLNYVLLYGGVEDFMNTTRLVRKMKLTSPKTGHQVKGS